MQKIKYMWWITGSFFDFIYLLIFLLPHFSKFSVINLNYIYKLRKKLKIDTLNLVLKSIRQAF